LLGLVGSLDAPVRSQLIGRSINANCSLSALPICVVGSACLIIHSQFVHTSNMCESPIVPPQMSITTEFIQSVYLLHGSVCSHTEATHLVRSVICNLNCNLCICSSRQNAGTICNPVFHTAGPLRAHQTFDFKERHAIQFYLRILVVCSKCMWCRSVFSSKESAYHHMTRSLSSMVGCVEMGFAKSQATEPKCMSCRLQKRMSMRTASAYLCIYQNFKIIWPLT
jgi:hypothetical protein